MTLKKVSVLLCCAIAVLTICTVLFLGRHVFPQQEKTISASSPKSMLSYSTSNTTSSQGSSPAAQTLASGPDIYLVKEYKGHIGVYRNGEKTPFREYPTDVAVLPQADQAALKQGKALHSMEEVEKLVEDYDG